MGKVAELRTDVPRTGLRSRQPEVGCIRVIVLLLFDEEKEWREIERESLEFCLTNECFTRSCIR